MAEYSVADELIKLKGLLDAGILTQEEFDTQKDLVLKRGMESNVTEQSSKVKAPVQYYEIKYTGFNPNAKLPVIKYVREITGLGLADGKEFVENPPKILKSGISLEECKVIRRNLIFAGGSSEIISVDSASNKTTLTDGDIKKATTGQKNSNLPRCPKCGSTAITTGARGVNLTWGFLGASKTVNRCANCGNTWRPK